VTGAGTLERVPISRRILADDEDVVVDLRLHWVFLAGPVVLTAVAVAVAITIAVEFPGAPVAVAGVLAAMIAVPALWLAGRTVRWLAISLVVTTTRIVFRQGVFSRDLVQLRLQRVAEVHCTQTVVDRLIGSGRLVIEVVGDQPLTVDDVRRPRVLQRVVTRQLDRLSHDAWSGPAAYGSEVPSAPVSVPRPVSLEATPPHGTPARPRWDDPPGPADLPDHAGAGVDRGYPAAGTPTGILPGVPPAASTPSIPEQLIQLDDLRRRGIISDGEFEAKKAELLSRL
jgi:membrane protein YdbS with pleckstrin-like domain